RPADDGGRHPGPERAAARCDELLFPSRRRGGDAAEARGVQAADARPHARQFLAGRRGQAAPRSGGRAGEVLIEDATVERGGFARREKLAARVERLSGAGQTGGDLAEGSAKLVGRPRKVETGDDRRP